MTFIHTVEYYSSVKENTVTCYVTSTLSDHTQEIIYNSVYMVYSEKTNVQWQEIDQWLPEAGGEMGIN